jgi:hypothetical protein
MRRAWVVAMVAACSFEHGSLPALGVDAAPPDTALVPDGGLGAWSAPAEIAELNSGYGEDDASLTGDLLEIYFGSKRPGGYGYEDIWRATRASTVAAWSTPVHVAELNSASSDTTAKLTPDGLAIFFTSMRGGNADLYLATRSSRSATWSTPQRVDALSTSSGDWGAAPRQDLLRVVWCAGPTVPDEALFVSTRASTSDTWAAPARLVELDEPSISECDPHEPHARAMYFASDRGGAYDIHRASRDGDSAPYSAPVEVTPLNLPASHDRDPWVSADERTIVFASNRSGIDRLYLSTR